MALTEEQQERIRKNRERALAIRRKKDEEAKANGKKESAGASQGGDGGEIETRDAQKRTKIGGAVEGNISRDSIEMEHFEIGASPYVTKQEAQEKYCLPKGTLEVCDYIEKDNPRNSKFSKMKLYHRNEVRRRARERFGGLQGLIEERKKREIKRFQKDFDGANEIFKSSKKKRRQK